MKGTGKRMISRVMENIRKQGGIYGADGLNAVVVTALLQHNARGEVYGTADGATGEGGIIGSG